MMIETVQQYISLIEKLKNNYTYEKPIAAANPAFGKNLYNPHFIFRGHSNHKEFTLLPSVLRWRDDKDGFSAEYSQMEHNILNDFIAEACRFIRDVPADKLPEWLEIAQHFGVPTRLLDFTENPLVALYFACSDFFDKDASVWIINEPTYNKKFFKRTSLVPTSESQNNVLEIVLNEIVYQDYKQHVESLNYVQYPWIYKPYYTAERMNSQSSIFMIWGARRQPLTDLFDDSDYMREDHPNNSERGIVCYIDIPANRKKSLLKQLDLLGINKKFIYPGIEGVGQYVKEKYSSNK